MATREDLLKILNRQKHLKSSERVYLIDKVNLLKKGSQVEPRELTQLFEDIHLSAGDRKLIHDQLNFPRKQLDTELLTEPPTYRHKAPNEFSILHQKYPHPIFPMAKTKDGQILCAHYTSSNHHCEEVILGSELGKALSRKITPEHEVRLGNILYNRNTNLYERKYFTWVHGEDGSEPLINLGKTSQGKDQYCSPILTSLTPEQFSRLSEFNDIPTPSYAQIIDSQRILLDERNDIKVIDPKAKNYYSLSKNDIIKEDLQNYQLQLSLREVVEVDDNSGDLPREYYLRILKKLLQSSPREKIKN